LVIATPVSVRQSPEPSLSSRVIAPSRQVVVDIDHRTHQACAHGVVLCSAPRFAPSHAAINETVTQLDSNVIDVEILPLVAVARNGRTAIPTQRAYDALQRAL